MAGKSPTPPTRPRTTSFPHAPGGNPPHASGQHLIPSSPQWHSPPTLPPSQRVLSMGTATQPSNVSTLKPSHLPTPCLSPLQLSRRSGIFCCCCCLFWANQIENNNNNNNNTRVPLPTGGQNRPFLPTRGQRLAPGNTASQPPGKARGTAVAGNRARPPGPTKVKAGGVSGSGSQRDGAWQKISKIDVLPL